MPRLSEEFDTLSKYGAIKKDLPEYIKGNLNPLFELRRYQTEAISRLMFYLKDFEHRIRPTQLLFQMATGSGKTLIMAASILYLYEQDYRNFIFFVNSTNIIEKTRDNFLNPLSAKFLFTEKINFNNKQVRIKEVNNFEAVNQEDINIIFTTVQGLHSKLNTPRENSITYEDFEDKDIVLISDEAHHINTITKKLHNKKLNQSEAEEIRSWEGTVDKVFQSNPENIMLEFTATAGLEDDAIRQKYDDKVIFQYSLSEFRIHKFSKEVQVLQADLAPLERVLQAVILSQYRRKVAAKNKLPLKPVVLMKSKTIAESKEIEKQFIEIIRNLKARDLQKIKKGNNNGIITKAFNYFKAEKITLSNIVREIKEDFAENKCLSVNSKDDSEEKQIIVNSLENADNEYRIIFAVDMLNEGWDVLNLFDIVRLYETRDSKGRIPGRTTISEAQLIGRGARYFPFTLNGNGDQYQRKFDENLDNPLRVLEELYYHSSHNPRYISELKKALVDTGIMPKEEKTKVRDLKVKESLKRTKFWEVGKIFINERKRFDRSGLLGLSDIGLDKQRYVYHCLTGQIQQTTIFEKESEKPAYKEESQEHYKLIDFGENVLRKALQRNDFFQFSNLKRYFPKLKSMSQFIRTNKNLSQVEIEVYGDTVHIQNPDADEKLEIAGKVLDEIRKQIIDGSTEYIGTKTFKPEFISVIVRDKRLKIVLDENSDKEYGRPMSEPSKEELFLDLKKKDWYVYQENFGTSEEKFFVKFINSAYGKLKTEFADIYLLRNANLFQLYNFSDGRAFEPDFVLFLRKKKARKYVVYQLFVEPKGQVYIENDKWKEEFLLEIEKEYKIFKLFENEDYKLVGMPFYNEKIPDRKRNFIDKFEEALSIKI